MAALYPSEMMHMPNNDTLIRVWAKILTISAMLCRREKWPLFVPDKGCLDKAADRKRDGDVRETLPRSMTL
jgi:hypothetical protein